MVFLRPLSTLRCLCFFLTAWSLVPGPAFGQDLNSKIDKIFSWVTPTSPGCVVAVSQHGKPIATRAYGLANLERNTPLGPNTVFDVGSVVKQFVSAATLLLVEQGRLSLSEDIRKHLPELPDYGHTITLDHLLTHTSGIRDWTGLGPLTGRQVDALTLTLRQRGLNFAPGEEWAYSNGGYVLLKEIVARTSRTSFGEFARKRLFEPLGMKSTAYLADGDDLENLALAYERSGNGWRPDMLVGNARGGGGALFSTAGDLLLWNDALTSKRLGTFVTEKIQEPAKLRNGRVLGYGRGLFLDSNRGGKVLWHSGGSAGYSSMVTRFPESGVSVATTCNAGEAADTAAVSRHLFDLLVPATRDGETAASTVAENAGSAPSATNASTAQAAATATAPQPAGDDLTGKAGLFFNEGNSQPLRIAVDKGRLRVQGGPPLETVAPDRFRNPRPSLSFMSQDQFELRFVSADTIEMKSMEGIVTRFRRAQPSAPTPSELQMLAGGYRNDETQSFMEITPGKEGVNVSLSGFPGRSAEFRSVDRDAFQSGAMIIRFRRDKTGNVVGLDYSNPVVRNIDFTRVKD